MARQWGRDEATSSYGVPGPRARRGGLPDGTGLLRLYESTGSPFSLGDLEPTLGPYFEKQIFGTKNITPKNTNEIT